MRGAIGRDLESGDRLIFEYNTIDNRTVHMVGVRSPMTVEFIIDGTTTNRVQLDPWTGWGSGPCNKIIETKL
jgi:uncharacterized membrane protein (UPF0127 family)